MKTANGMWRAGAVIACVMMTFCYAAVADEGTVPGKDGPIPIYPAPMKIEATGGTLGIGTQARIVIPDADEELSWVGWMLSAELGKALGAPGGRLPIMRESEVGAMPETTDIILGSVGKGRLAPVRVGVLAGHLSPKSGAYVLQVSPTGVGIY